MSGRTSSVPDRELFQAPTSPWEGNACAFLHDWLDVSVYPPIHLDFHEQKKARSRWEPTGYSTKQIFYFCRWLGTPKTMSFCKKRLPVHFARNTRLQSPVAKGQSWHPQLHLRHIELHMEHQVAIQMVACGRFGLLSPPVSQHLSLLACCGEPLRGKPWWGVNRWWEGLGVTDRIEVSGDE